jgi:hypothetical protein
MDVKEWMSYECTDEEMHQKKKIALEIAAKIASINQILHSWPGAPSARDC